MIKQAMETFAEWQSLENEQFRLSMHNAITTQFSNLGGVLLQNIQQAQMSMLGVVTAPTPVPQPPLELASLDPLPPPLAPIPPPLPSSPPPS